MNSTAPAFNISRPPADVAPPTWTVALNICWFSGLILSLSAAAVGLTVKQWTNEYRSGISGTSREVARLRQYRLNGLAKWRVGAIVATLPVLLQLALALFLSGLLILLWTLHPAVAGTASMLAGLLFLFNVCVAVLPSFNTDCSYASPQSIALSSVYKRLRVPAVKVIRGILLICTHILWRVLYKLIAPWNSDLALRCMAAGCNLFFVGPMVEPTMTWHGQEQWEVQTSTHALDTDTLLAAYRITMSADQLDTSTICFSDLPNNAVYNFLEEFHAVSEANLGEGFSERWKPNRLELWVDAIYNWIVVSEANPKDGETIATRPVWLQSLCNFTLRDPASLQKTEWVLSVLALDVLGRDRRTESQSWPALADILRTVSVSNEILSPATVLSSEFITGVLEAF